MHDVEMTSKLLTGEENELYGDSGYIGAEKRQDAIMRNKQGKKIRYKQNRKHRLTRAHREKQLKMSCQALHNAPPNRT